MKYRLTQNPTLEASDCLVIGICPESPLPDFAAALDKKYHGLLTRLVKKLTKPGDSAWQADIDGHSLLLVNCGTKTTFSAENLAKRFQDIIYYFIKERVISATICMPPFKDAPANWQIEQMLLQLESLAYQLLDFKTKNHLPHALETITFYLMDGDEGAIESAVSVAAGMQLTRTLANMPANICTPTYFGEQAKKLAEECERLQCNILDKKQIQALGMGALLGVAQGSHEPPVFIEMHYQGNPKKTAPIVLVGKGITFDSGGLSLKPAEAMFEMKYDMTGAATVLGTLKACALLQLPINVVGLIPCAENMLSGTSMRPGDIITSLSGQTIEIINTDAEGRLILADALTYAARFNPHFVIDVATLTGAVVVALGTVASGLMTKDEELAELILSAAKASRDRVWRLPLDADYEEALESPIADMVNANFDRTAGSIVAGAFLSRFTENYRWAHLDIAGTAWVSGKKRNATGRPVPLLVQLLRQIAHAR